MGVCSWKSLKYLYPFFGSELGSFVTEEFGILQRERLAKPIGSVSCSIWLVLSDEQMMRRDCHFPY